MLRKLLYSAIVLCCSSLATQASVYPITTVGFTYSPDTLHIALGDTVQFTLGNNHNAVEVDQATWNANGTTSNGGFNIPFGGGQWIPTNTGTFYYVCTPHASLGMKAVVVVHPPGSAQLVSVNNLQPCAGDTILGIINSVGFFHPTNQFQVLLSDASGSFANPSIVGTLNGSSGGVIQMVIPSGLPFGNGYMLAVQSTEPATTPQNMGGVLIISPAPQVQILGNTTACQGDTITLTASGGLTYTWSNGSNAPAIQVFQSSTVGLTGTNGFGCSSTSSQQITFNSLPSVGLTAADTLLCTNDTPIALQATPPGGNFGGDQTLGLINPQNQGPGSFAAHYTFTDNNGCSAADTFHYQVVNPTIPLFDLGVDTFCVFDPPITLDNLSGPTGGTYQGAGIAGNSFSPGNAGLGSWVLSYTYVDTNACSATTNDTIEVVNCPMGLQENEAEKPFAYPNPACNQVHFSQEADWQLYTLSGKLVRETQGNSMSLFGLPPGLYLLQSKAGQWRQKLSITPQAP